MLSPVDTGKYECAGEQVVFGLDDGYYYRVQLWRVGEFPAFKLLYHGNSLQDAEAAYSMLSAVTGILDRFTRNIPGAKGVRDTLDHNASTYASVDVAGIELQYRWSQTA